MTNPGHIDPGYDGPLHLTVINMSRDPFFLKQDDRIIRVLFMDLDQAPAADYQARHGEEANLEPITPELLNTLSADFINVTNRATKIASDQVHNANIIGVGIPIVVAIVAGLFGFYTKADKDAVSKLEDRTHILELKDKVDSRLTTLESKGNLESLGKRIDDIERQIKNSSPPNHQ